MDVVNHCNQLCLKELLNDSFIKQLQNLVLMAKGIGFNDVLTSDHYISTDFLENVKSPMKFGYNGLTIWVKEKTLYLDRVIYPGRVEKVIHMSFTPGDTYLEYHIDPEGKCIGFKGVCDLKDTLKVHLLDAFMDLKERESIDKNLIKEEEEVSSMKSTEQVIKMEQPGQMVLSKASYDLLNQSTDHGDFVITDAGLSIDCSTPFPVQDQDQDQKQDQKKDQDQNNEEVCEISQVGLELDVTDVEFYYKLKSWNEQIAKCNADDKEFIISSLTNLAELVLSRNFKKAETTITAIEFFFKMKSDLEHQANIAYDKECWMEDLQTEAIPRCGRLADHFIHDGQSIVERITKKMIFLYGKKVISSWWDEYRGEPIDF
jgi:hypothetical protein